MPKVKSSLDRHTVDQAAVRENLPHVTRLIDGLLEPSGRTPEFFLIAQAGFTFAGVNAAIDLSRPPICRGLHTAAKSLSAMFALAAATGEISVNIGNDEPQRLPASGPTSFTHCDNWRNGFFAACICRDREALDILVQTPMQILRSSSTRSEEAYYLYVEALQSLYLRSEDTGAKLLASLKSTDPAKLKYSSEDWVLSVLVPELDLASRLADGDEERFNESLRKAIERHKNYWSKSDRKQKGAGFLAIGPLGLASLAHDAGLKITVQSDYIPSFLWQGDCSKG